MMGASLDGRQSLLWLSFYNFLHTKYDNSCFSGGGRANLAQVKDELPWIQLSLNGFKGAESAQIRIRSVSFFVHLGLSK